MLKVATAVQAEPFHCSVFVTVVLVYPPVKIARAFVPAAHPYLLAVFTSVVSVQHVPFQDSTFAVFVDGSSPAIPNADVLSTPTPPKPLLI